MEGQIENLQQDILIWQKVLNEEGVWLFVATLSTWSTPEGWLRFVALALVLIIFFWRAIQQLTDKDPFIKRIVKLETIINQNTPLEDSDKARLYELSQLRKLFSMRILFKRNFIYILCFIFWVISYYEVLHPK